MEQGSRRPGRISLPAWLRFKVKSRHVRVFVGPLFCVAILFLVGVTTAAFYYFRFTALINERIAGNIYQSTSQVFSAPRRIFVGETLTSSDLLSELRSSGYSESTDPGAMGRYRFKGSAVEILPSAQSYFRGKNGLTVEFAERRISRLRLADSGKRLTVAEIEPELITNLFDVEREKRRPVHFQDLPKTLVQAVLAAEDKRFFDHPGFDVVRVLGAAWADLRRGEKAQGASTITMQVARTFFFDTRRQWSRKIKETVMAMMLEHRFTKEEILELYANQVYLGNRGSFAIRGFGEAAASYLGKDIRDLNLAESAFLAGIIRAPNRYSSAERRPERAAEARDRVLAEMLKNRSISATEYQKALGTPLHLVSPAVGGTRAAYFIDMVKDDLLERFPENDLTSESYRIYTNLDSSLQLAATQAIEWGMKNVETLLASRNARLRKRGEEVPWPQVALIALDPHTGEVKALVGGRDYAMSQLNHALAKRQPGSIFKAFVYGAAFETGLDPTGPVLTPATMVDDEPTTFFFDGKEYTPNNYGEEFYGRVSLREALTHSLNVATVKVAEMVGYNKVVELAAKAGLNGDLQATPAVALGAYDATPMEMAEGYTMFANAGVRSAPQLLHSVVGPDGALVEESAVKHRVVLDPRVTYLVTSILEDVLDRGTAAGVRARGFTAPAAGKTGTSHDGWFAGYTSNLLCLVWVGYDDNRELGLSGAASAAPIWTEFMKKAVSSPGYRDTQPFEQPDGVVSVTIDPESGQLARPSCPGPREEVFLAGTEPVELCALHGGVLPGPLSWLGKLRHIFRSRSEARRIDVDPRR